jgi:hypothetical protein
MARPYRSLSTALLIERRDELARELLDIGGRVVSVGTADNSTTTQHEVRIEAQINAINEELHMRGELDHDANEVLPVTFTTVKFV